MGLRTSLRSKQFTLSVKAMGSCCSKSRENSEQEATAKKQYSWDTREKVKDYIVENELDSIVMKDDNPGQQLIIRNCTNSKIFALINLDSVTIDDCENCQIVLGPVTGSVFMRDTKKSLLMAAAGQIRLRDSIGIQIFSSSPSDPVIETCSSIAVGPYYLNYRGIEGHFKAARLSRFSTTWDSVYDFTPSQHENNWSLFQGSLSDILHIPSGRDMTANENESFVPVTKPFKSPVRELVFPDEPSVMKFLREKKRNIVRIEEKEMNEIRSITLFLAQDESPNTPK